MTFAPEAHKTAGVLVADLLALGREIENTHGEEARKLLDAAAAALSSSPVPSVDVGGDGNRLPQPTASGAAAGWMPIETAPKDGTWFWAYRPQAGYGHWQRIVCVRWLEFSDDTQTEALADFVWPDETYDEFDPPTSNELIGGGFYEARGSFTHWRPLRDFSIRPAGDDPKALDAAARPSSTEAVEQEVERLREALTPSADTKAAYAGEFFELTEVLNAAHDPDDEDSKEPETIIRKVPVSWGTIKEIMAAIRDFARPSPVPAACKPEVR